MILLLALLIIALAAWILNSLMDIHGSVLKLSKHADLNLQGTRDEHRYLFVDGLF
ncbi:MAG: hypothetical protein ACK4L7_03785 [Flavobacteriales bacterium]